MTDINVTVTGGTSPVSVAVGAAVNSGLPELAVAAGANITVTTSAGVFLIEGRNVPVLSVAGRTGTVVLTSVDISDFASVASKYGPVSSVAGRTGTVVLTSTDISDFASVAAKYGPVSSVAGRTGTVVLTSTDISDFNSAVASKSPVSSVQGRVGTVVLTLTDLTAAAASHTHLSTSITDFTAEASKYGPVSSVQGKTGTVTLSVTDLTAAAASHTHSYLTSVNALTGAISLVAGSNIGITAAGNTITIECQSGLPSQANKAGFVVTTDGTTGSWISKYAVVDPVVIAGTNIGIARDTTANTLTFSSAVGTSGLSLSNATPLGIGTAASAGVALDVSRGDHVHTAALQVWPALIFGG